MSPEAPDSEKRTWKSRWPEGTGAGMWDRPPRGKGLLGQRHSMGSPGVGGRRQVWVGGNSHAMGTAQCWPGLALPQWGTRPF